MEKDPQDLPDLTDVTVRQLLDEMMEAYEETVTRLGHRCDAEALTRMPGVNWDLIRQLSIHRPTLEYLATSNAATFLRSTVQPTFAKIRRANEAACDLADELAAAAQKAEDKK